MSNAVSSHIWENSKQSGTKLVMMLKIADNCDDQGGCFPGQKYLADKTRLKNVKSVSGIVNTLADDGELTIVRRNGHSNYYFAREYCIKMGLDLQELLKGYGLKGPLEIVGGWENDPPSDEEVTPPEIVDTPPSDEEVTPHEIVDDPPSDGDIESSINHQSESSKKSSKESSSKSGDDDEDDFDLSDKELSIVRQAFGSLTKTAKKLLEKDKDETLFWSEYVIAANRAYDPGDDDDYVQSPSGFIWTYVHKDSPRKPLPVESEARRAARESAEKKAQMTPEEIEAQAQKVDVVKNSQAKQRRDDILARVLIRETITPAIQKEWDELCKMLHSSDSYVDHPEDFTPVDICDELICVVQIDATSKDKIMIKQHIVDKFKRNVELLTEREWICKQKSIEKVEVQHG